MRKTRANMDFSPGTLRILLPWLAMFLCLFQTEVISAQQYANEQICGLKGSGIREQYVEKFRLHSDAFLTYSTGQWSLTDSVHFEQDCMDMRTFLQLLAGPDMAIKLYADKVLIYRDAPRERSRPFDLSGLVRDGVTQEKLISATLFLPDQKRGTVTNAFGQFTVNGVRPGEPIVISFVGYQPLLILASPDSGFLEVTLDPSIQLDAVEVLSERQQRFEQLTSPDHLFISSEPYNIQPFLGGEPDVLKLVQQESGVLSNEVVTGPVVRGGEPDQNLVLLDDVPMYDYSHMLGFASVFNSDMINRVDFYKGSFPAQYGGRLSSVIDIRTKDGNPLKWQGNLTLGLFSQKLQLDGPLSRSGNMTLSGSARVATLEPLLRALPISEIKGFAPRFWDGHLKMNWQPNGKDQFNLLLFLSGDHLTDKNSDSEEVAGIPINFEQTENLTWQNQVLAGKWQRRWNQRVFSSTTLFTSAFAFTTRNLQEYRFTLPDEVIRETYDYFAFSSIQDFGLKSSWESIWHNNHQFKWGVEWIDHRFRPSIRREDRMISGSEIDSLKKTDTRESHEINGYAEWGFRWRESWRMHAGIRTSFFNTDGKTYSVLLPRWSAVYNINLNASVSAGYSRTVQFIHVLGTPVVGYPTDLWVPSTKELGPQYADLFFLNFSYLFRNNFFLQASTYYKSMKSLLAFKNDVPATEQDWQDQIISGNGEAVGLELSMERLKGKFLWGISYSLSNSTRRFSEVNGGRAFPFRFDRLHDLKIRLNYHFNDQAQIGLNWTLASGRPFTVGLINFQPQTPPGLAFPPTIFTGQRNNARMPWLHRLDLVFQLKREGRRHRHEWSLGIYNMYNRFNPFAVKVIAEGSSRRILLRETSLYPVLPFLNYKWSF